jgi:hypothetical protein
MIEIRYPKSRSLKVQMSEGGSDGGLDVGEQVKNPAELVWCPKLPVSLGDSEGSQPLPSPTTQDCLTSWRSLKTGL